METGPFPLTRKPCWLWWVNELLTPLAWGGHLGRGRTSAELMVSSMPWLLQLEGRLCNPLVLLSRPVPLCNLQPVVGDCL